MKRVQGKNGHLTVHSDKRNLGSASPNGPKSVRSIPSRFPQHYKVIDSSSDERILICLEAPNIPVQVEAGIAIASSSAHKSPPGTIYLDGVAQSEPFKDLEKQIYNFDHPEGCLRPFTISTCEQVIVMLLNVHTFLFEYANPSFGSAVAGKSFELSGHSRVN